MATQSDDVIRRNVARELYCKLSEDEFVRISRTRVNKEAERDQLVEDLDVETKKRKQQIKLLEDEIGKMGRELRTGEQERTVKTNEVFRNEEGTGWVVVVRLDTFDEVERRPATAHETQRYLPNMDAGGGGLLDKAARAQRSAGVEAAPEAKTETDDVPADTDEGDGEKSKNKRGGKGK
jgi:hypothetical protein